MFLVFILVNLNLEIKNLMKIYNLNPNKVSICIYSIEERKIIYTYNKNKPLIPASNLKILLSVYLLENWDDNFANYLRKFIKKRRYHKQRVLAELNSKSNNKLADLLFYLIGEYNKNKVNSGRLIKKFLKERKIPIDGLRIIDGSGRSKMNRLTSNTLINLLIYYYHSPYQKEFLRSLAVSGKKGTLKNRLLNYQGRIIAKTGYLENVRSLSGYYFKKNRKYIFSIIINGNIKPENYWNFLNDFFALL